MTIKRRIAAAGFALALGVLPCTSVFSSLLPPHF
jgi:hypothetical protein